MSGEVRRLAVLREAGYLPLIDVLRTLAGQGGMEAVWLKARGRLCSGEASAFIVPHDAPLLVPAERWFSPSTDDAWQTGMLILRRTWSGIRDGVMNRPNLNPGAIKASYALSNLDGRFTVFLERSSWPLPKLCETPPSPRVDRTQPKRRTGPKPVKTPRVMREMRKMDPHRLNEMKIEEMIAVFGAGKTTVSDARKRVLYEGNSGE